MRSTRCVRAFNWDELYGAVIKVPVCSEEAAAFLAEESVEIDSRCIKRPVRTTSTANVARDSETKKPVLRRFGRGLEISGLCSDSPVILFRGGRIIGERSASLGIKLPG